MWGRSPLRLYWDSLHSEVNLSFLFHPGFPSSLLMRSTTSSNKQRRRGWWSTFWGWSWGAIVPDWASTHIVDPIHNNPLAYNSPLFKERGETLCALHRIEVNSSNLECSYVLLRPPTYLVRFRIVSYNYAPLYKCGSTHMISYNLY